MFERSEAEVQMDPKTVDRDGAENKSNGALEYGVHKSYFDMSMPNIVCGS
jgi:hypothetical protein